MKTKKKYKDWIKQNVLQNCIGMCKEITQKMIENFPELKRVRGHYYCPIWGEREHWWLTTDYNRIPQRLIIEEEIIDPTKSQFPSKGLGLYVKWDETQEEPTGKCPNCGNYCYKNRNTCSDECDKQYLRYLNSLV